MEAGSGEDGLLGDLPTWIGGRTRTEPWFGEAHARTAARILHEDGEHELAIAAWCWSLVVDEWDPKDVAQLAELLHAQWDRIGAWALQIEARRRFPAAGLPHPGGPPFALSFEGVKALLDAYRAAVRHHHRDGDVTLAAALSIEHNRLADRMAARHFSLPDAEALPVVPPPPARHVGAYGWIETGLVDFEKRRVRGLWFAEPTGDLILGRNRPRPGTGTAGRDPHAGAAFVRSRDWLSRGRYVVRARIHVEAGPFHGALVLGYARRDRNIRVRFQGGEPLDSVGKKEERDRVNPIASLVCRIDGRFRRDRNLPGARPRRVRRFSSPRSSFQLEAIVDGDRVHIHVDGEPLASYRTPDGSPIEGYVGFASRRGSFRVQFPVVVRHHGIPRDRLARSWPRGLDPAEPDDLHLTDLLNRATRGFPRSAAGTVVLWIPPMGGDPVSAEEGTRETDEEDASDRATETFVTTHGLSLVTGLRRRLQEHGYREPPAVAVPEAVSEATRTKLRKALDSRGAIGVKILVHGWPARALSPGSPVERERSAEPEKATPVEPHLLFIDTEGTLRTVEPYSPGTPQLPRLIRRWAWVLAKEARAGLHDRGGRR